MRFQILIILFICTVASEAQIVNSWSIIKDTNGLKPTTHFVKAMSALSKDVFAVALNPKDGYGPAVVFTDNGGEKFETVINGSIKGYYIHDIAMPSEDKIICVSNKYLMTTTDKGKTWKTTSLEAKTAFDCVAMLNDSCGLISKNKIQLAIPYGELLENDTLLYSDDFFASYKKIILPDTIINVNYIKMFSNTHFIIGFNNEILGSEYGYYETTDQGNTWVKKLISNQVFYLEYVTKDIAFKIETPIYPYFDRSKYLVKKTTNNGQSWETVLAPQEITEDYQIGPYIAAADANNVIVYLPKIGIFRTQDGGIHWEKESLPPLYNQEDLLENSFNFIKSPEPNLSYLYVDNYLFKSTGQKQLANPEFIEYPKDCIINKNIIVGVKPVDFAEQYHIVLHEIRKVTGKPDQSKEPVLDTISSSPTIEIPPLKKSSSYYAKAKALSKTLSSEYTVVSKLFCINSNDDFIFPPNIVFPSNFSSISQNSVDIVWESVPNADSYHVIVDNELELESFLDLTDTVIYNFKLVYNSSYLISVRVKIGDEYSEYGKYRFRNVLPTSIKDLIKTNEFDISFFPNPAQNYIEIINNQPEKMNYETVPLRIFNVFGEIVLEGTLNNNDKNQRLDISGLSNGIYFLSVSNRAQKFIISK